MIEKRAAELENAKSPTGHDFLEFFSSIIKILINSLCPMEFVENLGAPQHEETITSSAKIPQKLNRRMSRR